MFQYIISNPKEDTYYEQDLFPYPDGCVHLYIIVILCISFHCCVTSLLYIATVFVHCYCLCTLLPVFVHCYLSLYIVTVFVHVMFFVHCYCLCTCYFFVHVTLYYQCCNHSKFNICTLYFSCRTKCPSLVVVLHPCSVLDTVFVVYCLHPVPFQCRPESISTVKEWLKKLPSEGVDSVDCGSLTLDKPQIAAIEKAINDMQVCVCVVGRGCSLLSLINVRTQSKTLTPPSFLSCLPSQGKNIFVEHRQTFESNVSCYVCVIHMIYRNRKLVH